MCYLPFAFFSSLTPYVDWLKECFIGYLLPDNPSYYWIPLDGRVATEVSRQGSWYDTNRAVTADYHLFRDRVQNKLISHKEVSDSIKTVIEHLESVDASVKITITDLAVVKWLSTVSPFSPQASFELKGLSNGLECDIRNTGTTRCLLRNKMLILRELDSKLAERNMRIEALLN